MTALGPEGFHASPHTRGLLSLLSSCWVLMATPSTSLPRQVDGRWGGPPTPRTRGEDLVTTMMSDHYVHTNR